jgi:Undecaprenyl-phosphate glucose phosphotransferase
MSRAMTSKPISEPIVTGFLRAVDVLCVLAAGAVAFGFWVYRRPDIDWQAYSLVTVFGALLAHNLFQIAGAYRFSRLADVQDSLLRVLAGWVGGISFLLAISFLTKTSSDFSRGWALLWCAGSLALLGLSRTVLAAWIRRWRASGRLCRTIAVVGAGPIGQRLLRHFNSRPHPGLKIVGVYDDRLERLPSRCMGQPIVGNLDRLLEDARARHIDMVVVALPLAADWRLARVMEKLRLLPIDILLCPDHAGFRLKPYGVSELDGMAMLNIADRPLRDWRLVGKEIEDRVLASLILLLIAPLMALIALAIKLDSPGPVFFRQRRYGFNNQLIEVFKFRTMHHHASDPNAAQLTRRNDPRVTRIGAFLRRTSLDELPQFFNVLRGEMSVVGPRPHALAAKAGGLLYQDAVSDYAARHRVKPGITGWAQVNGWRGETEVVEQIERRVEHDLYYIDHWSLLFDLKIIVLTVFGGFTGRYAY